MVNSSLNPSSIIWVEDNLQQLVEMSEAICANCPDYLVIKSLNHFYRSYKGISCYLIITPIHRYGGQELQTYLVDSMKFRQYLWNDFKLWRLLETDKVCKVIVNQNEFLSSYLKNRSGRNVIVRNV